MSRAWMPLYIADFLADTQHLDNAEIGAYLLLIMHYWQHGGLPDSDEKIRLICRLPHRTHVDLKRTIKPFFQNGWKHKRIDQELEKSRDVSSKRSANALARWGNKHANAHAIEYANGYAKRMHRARVPQSHIKKDSLIGEEARHGAADKSIGKGSGAGTVNEEELRRHVAGHKVRVEQHTKAGEAWSEWSRKVLGKSQCWDAKGGWWFPSEYPPTQPSSPSAS